MRTNPRCAPAAAEAAVHSIYRLCTPEECMPHFARVLAATIPGEAHACMVREGESDRRLVGLEPATAEHPGLLAQFAPQLAESPPALHRRLVPTHEALAISDFLSAREFEERGIFRPYYLRVGLRDVMSVTFQHGPAHGCLAVGRARRTFRAGERAVLNRLRPHFHQAYANALAFAGGGFSAATGGVGRLDGEWSQAVVLVRWPEGRIEHCPGRAAAMLKIFFAGEAGASRLPGVIGRWLECHRRDDPGTAPVLRIAKDGQRLAVRALHDTAGRMAVLFFETEAAGRTAATAALFSAGLTAREAEVLSWLAEGKANGDIAVILGLRRPTVKVHLENIYRKLGVENRASAIIMALKSEAYRPADAAEVRGLDRARRPFEAERVEQETGGGRF